MSKIKLILTISFTLFITNIFADTDNIFDNHPHNLSSVPFSEEDGIRREEGQVVGCLGRICNICAVGTLDADCVCDNCGATNDFCIGCEQELVPAGNGTHILLILSIIYGFFIFRRQKKVHKVCKVVKSER